MLSAQERNKTFYSLDYSGLNFILLDFWWSSAFSILNIVQIFQQQTTHLKTSAHSVYP